MTFVLDARLAADCLPVGRFGLSRLLLMNDAAYPWLILVPERPGISELFELDAADLATLAAETALVAGMLKALMTAEKINVAALGNVVAQLHVHVIARSTADPAWPAPVWGRTPARPYAAEAAAQMLNRIGSALQALSAAPAAGDPAAKASPAERVAATWRLLTP